MPAKKFDPTILFQSCQTVFKKTRNQPIQSAEQLNLEKEVALLSDFFGIDELAVYLLAYYIYKSLNDDNIFLDKMIEHFGDDLAQLPAINKAICSLIKKERLQEKTKNTNGKIDAFVSAVIHPRTIKGLLEGDKKALKNKPVKSFVELLDAINKQIDLKSYDTISGNAMHAEVESLLITNKHFKELQWLKQFNLSTTEKIFLLLLVAEAMDNIDVSSLPELINKAAVTKQEAYQFQNYLITGISALLLHDLIEIEPNQFMQCELGSISRRCYNQFFHEGNLLRKKAFHTRVSTLIENEKIDAEPLFFNGPVAKQTSTLAKALQEDHYQQLRNKIKGTNKGFTLLFHGAPGTGKTALVKQMALQSGRHLLMADTAAIKNMYVGESEKNIRRIFKEYEAAKRHFALHPILLFNEADALIGKRIIVNSSVDQMNNAMQNILLQYLEDFEGIFIATTNLPASLDDAFNRRFLYKVEFKNPDKEVRMQLLEHHFPSLPQSYLKQLNERYPLTGAQLMNINKKLLVEQLLSQDIDQIALLEQLCAEERALLTKHKAQPIGFMKRA